jgi:hypothetical protein
MPTHKAGKEPRTTAHGEFHPTATPGEGTPTGPAREQLVQLMRQGLGTSLRSVQVWAELTRALDATPTSPANQAVITHAHRPIETLLAAQRQVIDQLATTQQHLARHLSGER